MFELDKYDHMLQKGEVSSPQTPYEPELNLKEMSLLFWTEHCVECAAPSCYETCDLYEARSDKRCRRFTFGALKNSHFSSFRGYGVEVLFKKWAKIEAIGNLSMAPARSVLKYERLLGWAAPFANSLGKVAGNLTGNANWHGAAYIGLQRIVEHLGRKNNNVSSPDAFLLEVYNPGAETTLMQLTFLPLAENEGAAKELINLGPSFITTVAFPTGYSRHQIDFALLRPVLNSGRPFKISMIPEADNNARLVFLTADFVRFANVPSAESTKKIKCVVWDLDNTLWNGVLIEGDAVTVKPEVLQLLKYLDDRGILMSIASKNDHAFAWEKLKQLGITEYFLYPQINWMPKSASLSTIAERLNIGLDTFAFIDDNPFELDQVGGALPDVVCVNTKDISALFEDPRFRGSTSAESRRRRRFYQEAIAREDAQQEAGSNYIGFLSSCGIVLEIAPYSPEDSERVAELVQRTNQLNFSGHKYTRVELDDVLADTQLEKYVLKSSDNYGSYGTVGFSIVEQRAGSIHVRDFMLSCRVQGKFIEQAFFHHLVEHHNPQGTNSLWVNFHATPRNKPAQQVLQSLGFEQHQSAEGRLFEGVLHSAADSLRCDFIEVHCSADPTEFRNVPSNLAESVLRPHS
jgi:FkbH-like protein